jgi:hypothetical protein
MKNAAQTVLPFPCASSYGRRRALRKSLLRALRVSESPVLVNLSNCRTLNHEDIGLLLDCVGLAAGRNTPVVLVAGSGVIRVLLEVIRVSSLVQVFNSIEEALGAQTARENSLENVGPPNFSHLERANEGVRE